MFPSLTWTLIWQYAKQLGRQTQLNTSSLTALFPRKPSSIELQPKPPAKAAVPATAAVVFKKLRRVNPLFSLSGIFPPHRYNGMTSLQTIELFFCRPPLSHCSAYLLLCVILSYIHMTVNHTRRTSPAKFHRLPLLGACSAPLSPDVPDYTLSCHSRALVGNPANRT
jgi:hypothetical protein